MYVCKYCVEIKILKENSSGFSMNIESNGTFFTKIVNQRQQKVLHGDVISKFEQIIRHISKKKYLLFFATVTLYL